MQRGIAAVLILIVLAVIIGAIAIIYGYFVLTKNNSNQSSQTGITEQNLEAIKELGSTDCPDTDYTGCDVSSKWMTWSEKDVIQPQISPETRTSQEGTIYSK